MRIKSSQDIHKAYTDSINNVPSAYVKGVDQVNDWQEKAIAGQDLYEQMMRDSAVLNRRKVKLAGVSNEQWKGKAKSVGSTRIAAGMQANADKRTQAYEPYRQELAALELPAKTADPLTNVTNRVGGIAVKLHAKKVEMSK